MKTITIILKSIGKVILALLTGILVPILIWVALGVALNQTLREKKVKQPAAPTAPEALKKDGLAIEEEARAEKIATEQPITQLPVLDINEILAAAGYNIQDENATKNCWEVLNCPKEKYEVCPDYVRHKIPLWVANGIHKGG